MIRIFQIIKTVYDDKKYGLNGRNDRVTKINALLGLCRMHCTKPYWSQSGNKYVTDYHRLQFWYDNRPITIKAIWNCFNGWHVMHWLKYDNGGRCGFHGSIVNGRFSKRKIYKWLEQQSECIDKIITKV